MTEGTPAPMWEPGDPLYRHPHYRASGDGNYVREFLSIMCDEDMAIRHFLGYGPRWMVKCVPCLVGWTPDEGDRCWVCGKRGFNYGEAALRAASMRKDERSAFLRGGPRDGMACEVSEGRNEIVVALPPTDFMASFLVPSDRPEQPVEIRTGRYTRSYFNYWGSYWVYEYMGPAVDSKEEPTCSNETPGCSTKGIHEYCIYKEAA